MLLKLASAEVKEARAHLRAYDKRARKLLANVDTPDAARGAAAAILGELEQLARGLENAVRGFQNARARCLELGIAAPLTVE